MKRILALVLLAVLVSANAFAQAVDQAGNRLTATFGDQDSAKNYRLSADTTGLVQYANDTSIAYPYESINTSTGITSAYTLTSTDSGSAISDWGGTSIAALHPGQSSGQGATYTLPQCTSTVLGMNFVVTTAVKETITVTPSVTTDSIDYSILGTGLSNGVGLKTASVAASGNAGDAIGVICVAPGQWQVLRTKGVTVASAP